MYVWDWTRRSGWQLKKIGTSSPSSLPSNFQIWRENNDGDIEMVIALDNYKAVIDTMAKLEQSEMDRGAVTITKRTNATNPNFAVMSGFTVSTEQRVIVTNDGSGLPRYRLAHAPSAHYWVEAVFPEQCGIENARYALSPRHVRENRA
jgi:hypothetical protein